MTPERVYAVGDIHGWLDKLVAVHEAIEADLAARPVASHLVVHIGDYTDRGPDSRGVIDYLIDGAIEAKPWRNLYGNHDRMFLRFLQTPGGRDPMLRQDLHWLHPRLGGVETLNSYGLNLPEAVPEETAAEIHAEAREAVPDPHIRFLTGLSDSYAWKGWFFAHAGVLPGVALAMQDEDDLLWVRGPFLNSKRDHGAVVVHGHTPTETGEVEDHGNRIAIDTGAGYGGPIGCIALEGGSARVLGGPVLRTGD